MTRVAHAGRAHARLSPSGAKRFMACPGSIRLTEHLPRQDSVYSREGTAAHELAEHCLNTGFDAGRFVGEHRLVDGHQIPVTHEMAMAVQDYIDHVLWFSSHETLKFEVSLEERLSVEHVVPGMFGTTDCLVYCEETKHLFVIDYKHGRGVAVEPEENPQLMTYALGALKRYGNRPVEKVTLTIVQPRAAHPRGSIRSWETTPDRLRRFADDLADAAIAVDMPDAPLVPGDHCTFCPAAGTCPALRERALSAAQDEFESVAAEGSDLEELAKALTIVGTVEIWCKKVRETAHARAVAGEVPPGFKLVRKRGHRKWKDESSVPAALRFGAELEDDEIFERKLRTPPQIEKVLGKQRMGILTPLITQGAGLVLAPESDPREAAQPSAEDEFEDQGEA